MRSGRLHIAGVSTGPNRSLRIGGLTFPCDHGSKDGRFGYEMEMIVPADSPIKTPADIKAKNCVHCSHVEFRLQGTVRSAGVRN